MPKHYVKSMFKQIEDISTLISGTNGLNNAIALHGEASVSRPTGSPRSPLDSLSRSINSRFSGSQPGPSRD